MTCIIATRDFIVSDSKVTTACGYKQPPVDKLYPLAHGQGCLSHAGCGSPATKLAALSQLSPFDVEAAAELFGEEAEGILVAEGQMLNLSGVYQTLIPEDWRWYGIGSGFPIALGYFGGFEKAITVEQALEAQRLVHKWREDCGPPYVIWRAEDPGCLSYAQE